jgi:hypothetical protein
MLSDPDVPERLYLLPRSFLDLMGNAWLTAGRVTHNGREPRQRREREDKGLYGKFGNQMPKMRRASKVNARALLCPSLPRGYGAGRGQGCRGRPAPLRSGTRGLAGAFMVVLPVKW